MSKQEINEIMSGCHRQLDEMFLLHQELVLETKLSSSIKVLESYWRCHACHMGFEDKVLIPQYDELEKAGRWNATLYHQEHQKIIEIFEKIEMDLRRLCSQKLDKRQLNRNIIVLLERQKTFKGLCEHHQEREEASMFVELDRQTDANWRQEKLAQFSESWELLLATELKAIKGFFKPSMKS